ncbi:MAG: ABC transporter permease subunit [Eubacterium sp.]|nr:ABC transporter permease subunit [Eubacterium sp.]
MMQRIILTDLRRAQKKKSYIICMSIIVVLMLAICIFAVIRPSTSEALAEQVRETSGKALKFLDNVSIAFSLFPFVIGIPVFQTVFSDDFKSRTMQTAIGYGVSRRRLVLCRFFEAIALIVEACMIFTVIGVIIGFALGGSVGGIGQMVGKLLFDQLLLVANIAIAMLVLYLTQNPTGGLVMFILLAADVFRLILALADMIPFLKNNGIKLSNIVPSGVHQIARNYMFGHVPSLSEVSDIGQELEEGSADAVRKILEGTTEPDFLKALGFIAILVGVFIILPVILAQVVFRKKELEF